MILGSLQRQEKSTNLDIIRQWPNLLTVGAGRGCFDIFSTVSFSLPLGLKYRLKPAFAAMHGPHSLVQIGPGYADCA